MKQYSTVLFDFDLTLVDSSEAIIDCIETALSKMKYRIPEHSIVAQTIGMSLEESYVFLTNDKSIEKQKVFREYFLSRSKMVMHELTKVFDDTLYVLESLKKNNIKVGVVSSKDLFAIEMIAKKHKFLSYIDVIISEDDVMYLKPSPLPLCKAIDLLDENISNVLYIGDSFTDALAAEAAKIDFIGVTTGATTKEEFSAKPNICIISELKQILNIILVPNALV